MPTIDVHTAFKLNLGSRIVPFAKGIHENVSEEVAGHVYTAFHATVVVPDPVIPVEPPVEPVAAEPVQEATPDDKDALRARAEAMGIATDKRWGIPRLKAEIAAHEAPTGTGQPPKPDEQVAAE